MDAGEPGNRNACALVKFIDLVYIYIIYPVDSRVSMININPDNPYARVMFRLYSFCKGLKSEISVECDLNLIDPNLIGHVCI